MLARFEKHLMHRHSTIGTCPYLMPRSRLPIDVSLTVKLAPTKKFFAALPVVHRRSAWRESTLTCCKQGPALLQQQ